MEPTIPPFDLSFARAVLAAQSFSVLLGTTITVFGPDLVELCLSLRTDLKQQHGFAHGGVVSYLADNAIAFAGGSALKGDVVTSEYKINYLRPAKGGMLIARANVLHAGRQQAVCDCKIYCQKDGQESMVAVAQGTITLIGVSSENRIRPTGTIS